MTLSENFDSLKRQMEELGYRDPGMADRLREELLSGKDLFAVSYREQHGPLTLHGFFNISRDRKNEPFKLDDYDTILLHGDNILTARSFTDEVGKKDAQEVLAKDALYPVVNDDTSLWVLNPKGVKEYLHEGAPAQIDYWKQLSKINMNEQNFEYLKDNIKYLGFDEKLADVLHVKMTNEVPEFTLPAKQEHFDNWMEYTLHFRKSDSSDMYFLNKYDATLTNNNVAEDRSQTFYLNKGHGVTAKEAFNLLEGRAVQKEFQTKEGERYKAWIKLDFTNKDEKTGNYKINQYGERYGYDLEKALERFDLKELNNPEQKSALVKSLEKGNRQQVTVEQDGKPVKYFIEANPQYKNINAFDDKHKQVRREKLYKQD